MTREGGNGGGQTFVRVFDRSDRRAVAIRLYEDFVWTIGEPIDLSPLDLFGDRVEFTFAEGEGGYRIESIAKSEKMEAPMEKTP